MVKRSIPKKKRTTPTVQKTALEYELLGGVSVSAAALLVVSIFVMSSLDSILIRSQQYASVLASVLVDLTNDDRSSNELHTLKVNPVLQIAAQAKADDMAAKGYFAHVSPEGRDPWYWIQHAGYSFDYAGENLAVDFSDSTDVERAWMNSPSHRDNLLNGHYTEIGIATAEGMYQGHRTTFVVQEFGRPSIAAVTRHKVQQVVPNNPTVPATATVQGSAVLGESSAPITTQATTYAKSATAIGAGQTDATQPSISVASMPPTQAPWWARYITSPRDMMKIIYSAFGFLIIFALMIATGFEIRTHHRGKAFAAGSLVVLMIALFIGADTFVFPSIKLPQNAAMTSSVAAASSL